jgi:diguanylate cyclase (GGDEF)-like protein
MVVWAFYLMAILMTALRNDGRLTLYAGALSLLQYGTLAALVLALTHAPEQLLSVDYGSARLSNILQRELLIAITTAITSVVVFRMQHLVELSGNDGLTGLPNRTLLIHRFPDLIEAAQATGRSLSLGLIDLDYFRRVNDEAGHAAGDQALRHVVRILGQRLEESDWLVRLGGEEFALVLPLPAGSAWEKLDRLRLDVAATPFQPETGAPPIRLTFSAGIASWPHDGMELSQLLRRADLRLRQAKLTGRNRVVARDQ